MNFKLLLLIIIFFIINFNNNNNFIKSQLIAENEISTLTISDVGYLDQYNKYEDYPYYSNGDRCRFTLYFLVKDTNINSNGVTVKSNFQPITIKYLKTEKSSTVISLSLEELDGVQADTMFSFFLNATSTILFAPSIISEYRVNFKCNPINTSTIQLITYPTYSTSPKDGALSLVQINGLPSSFNGLLNRKSNFRVENYGNNLFLFHWLNRNDALFDPVSLEDTILFKDQNFSIVVLSCFVDNNSKYEYAIALNTVYQQIGYALNPNIEININSSLSKPYLTLILNNTNVIDFTPLYGVMSNMNYIATFIDLIADGITPRIHSTKIYLSEYRSSSYPVTIKKFIPIILNKGISVDSYNNINTHVSIVDLKVDFYENQFCYFICGNGNEFFNIEYPFGHMGTNQAMRILFSYPISDKYYKNLESVQFGYTDINDGILIDRNTSGINDFNAPIVKSCEFIQVSGFVYILRMNIIDESGLSSITNGAFQISKNIGDSLVSGDLKNGIFEFIVKLNIQFQDIILKDIYGNLGYFGIGEYLTLEPNVIQYQIPTFINSFYNHLNTFSDISFKYNDVNVSISPSYNTVYFTPVARFPKNKPFEFILKDPISKGTVWPVFWDASIGKFVCDFIIPSKTLFGQVEYDIRLNGINTLSNYQFPSFQLRVNQNTYLDNSGPTFLLVEPYSNQNFNYTGNGGLVGWKIHINDIGSGFSNGYIKAMGSKDNSIYHFNFTNLNCTYIDPPTCSITLTIPVSFPCVKQDYVMQTVILTDLNSISSYYEVNEKSPSPTTSPFRYEYYDSKVNRVSYDCSQLLNDDSDVILNSFKITTPTLTDTIDVGLSDENQRTITINFNATQAISGIQLNQLPIVYIMDQRLKEVKGTAKLISFSSNEFNAFYQCNITLPLGFGYPGSLYFSVYGLLSKSGYFFGYSTSRLQGYSYSYYLETTFSIDNRPTILANEFITSKGGNLLIYGKGFKNNTITLIKYLDQEPNGEFIPIGNSNVFSTVLQINDIVSTTKPYIIMINDNGYYSNQYKVYPLYFNTTFGNPIITLPPTSSNPVTPSPSDSPSPSPSDSPTPSPSSTPPPTTAPQKCYGNPVCGGPSKGYCEARTGSCICFSPNIGTACESTIIIIPQPSTNNSEPTILIPVSPSDSNNNNNNNEILYKSLISIVGLRELDYMNNQVSLELFDKWEYNQLSDTKNQYTTTSSNTLITVTLEWFENESIINFANINLTMHPSTIKYTIHLSEYEFQNNLNTLQLIMSASISNDANNHCSSKQFSDINIDSNYMKLKIDNYSLYGRFIKRAQLNDSKIIAIENQLLDSSFNSLPSTTSSESRSQSYIAISIPNYKNSITIDPDFSVLLDSQNAKDDENSICKTSNGLKGTQISGIVIGSVAFATIIAVSIGYYIYRKKSYANMVKNFAKKLNKI